MEIHIEVIIYGDFFVYTNYGVSYIGYNVWRLI